jgi:hypothetical protein
LTGKGEAEARVPLTHSLPKRKHYPSTKREIRKITRVVGALVQPVDLVLVRCLPYLLGGVWMDVGVGDMAE